MSDFLKGIKFPGIDKVYKIPQNVSDLKDKDQYVTKNFLGENNSFSGTGTVSRIDGISPNGKLLINSQVPMVITGKNFLPKLLEVNNEISIESYQGVWIEMLEDGTLTLGGTLKEGANEVNFYSHSTSMIPSGRYVFSGLSQDNPGIELKLTNTYNGAEYILENEMVIEFSNEDNGLIQTIDYPEGPYEWSIKVPSGVVLNNYIIRPQLELLPSEGVPTPSVYEPYVGEDMIYDPGEGETWVLLDNTTTITLFSLNVNCPFTWYYYGNDNAIHKTSQLINDAGYINGSSVSIADFGTAVYLNNTKDSGIIKVETEASQVVVQGKNLMPFLENIYEEEIVGELNSNNIYVLNGHTHNSSPVITTQNLYPNVSLPVGNYIISRNPELLGMCELELEVNGHVVTVHADDPLSGFIPITAPAHNCVMRVLLEPNKEFYNVPINIQLEAVPSGVTESTEFVPYYDDIIYYDTGTEITPIEGGTTIFASDLQSEVKCRYIGGRQAIHKTSQLENDVGFLTRDEVIALIQELI